MSEYDDLWVKLKFTLETSDYCKKIRETNFAPAFGTALCDKCEKKDCRFLDICIELYVMSLERYKSEEK